MKTFLRQLLPCVGAILLLLLIGHLREAKSQEMAVQTIHPEAASHHTTLAAQGDIVAWEVMPMAAEMGGQRIVQIQADVGDRVKKGQLLALLDESFVKLEIDRLQAQTQQAAIALQQAKDNAERARQLQASAALPQQQIEAMLAEEQSATQQVHNLQAQLHSQQLRLARSRLLAPDDGVVLSKEVALGQVVGSGQVLFRLLRQGKLEWHARVGAGDVARITPGMKATLHVGKDSIHGTVRTIQPDMNSRTREAQVYVSLDAEAAHGLLPGMFARGSFDLGVQQAWRVPHAAVVMRDARSMVWKVEDSGLVRALPVAIVAQTADYMLLSGIGAADAIVARGGEFLAEGERVAVLAQ